MERYEVFIKPAAKEDLREIFRYITEILNEPNIAERICDTIETAILTLSRLPLRHGVSAEEPFTSRGIRKMPVKNYAVFYNVDDSGVHILRIIHSRRKWQSLV